MSKRPVCRACLVDNLTMYRVTNSPYEEIYEKLSNAKVDKGNLPETFCYICMTMLRKFQKFAALTQESNIMLEQWYRNEIDCKPKKRPQFKISTTTVEYITSKIPDPDLTKEVKVKIEPDDTEAMNQVQFIELTNESDPYGEETTDVNMDASNFKGSDSWSDAEQKPGPASDEEFEVPIVKQEPRKRAVKAEKTPKGIKIKEKVLSETQENVTTKPKTFDEKQSVIWYNPARTQGTAEKGGCGEKLVRNNSYILHGCSTKTANEDPRKITNSKIFTCDFCDVKTPWQSTLKRHVRIKHSHDKIFCKFCPFEAVNKNHLLAHVMKRHTGGNKYECDICGYEAKKRSNLVTHMTEHNYLYSQYYKCDLCEYKSTKKKNLRSHRKRVHPIVKPFLCDICDYKTAEKACLNKHLKTHKSLDECKYVCSECGRKFAQRYTLITHVRVHTGEKPYVCDICGHNFTQKSAFNTHMRRRHSSNKK